MALTSGCGESGNTGTRLFTKLSSNRTGVDFANNVTPTREMNVFNYINFYNGGGVALGDLTGDGLPELMLTSNQNGSRLYLNTGDLRFKDVTDAAGVRGRHDWITGVAFADINGDGLLDIYVCYAGTRASHRRANELFVNKGLDTNGAPIFEEMARQYGLADEGLGIHAAFVDYDRDGDLDVYLVNNPIHDRRTFGLKVDRRQRQPPGGHRLFRNDSSIFTDVTDAAGIYGTGVAYGLGVALSDFNRDGWPDVYVSNDFFERDYLYINQRNGAFAEALPQRLPYVSYFSMGLDAADLDDDSWPDLFVTDMLPADDYRAKTLALFETPEIAQAQLRNDYHRQVVRNMLHRNNRDGTFSDVGLMAGVARTDWSWSALVADFDLDGRKDIHVTNGWARDASSLDFGASLDTRAMSRASSDTSSDFLAMTARLTETKLPDYAFRNRGDFTFEDVSDAWGLSEPSHSHGAAYGDLDADGDLDLVVNNVDDEAFVFRNDARSKLPQNRYLQLALRGEGANRFGVGSKVTLRAGDRLFFQELYASRGYQSSVDYVLTFGLGPVDTVDSVTVEWPDGRVSVLREVASNQRVTIQQAQSSGAPPAQAPPIRHPLLVQASDSLSFVHRENAFADFARDPLVPKLLSTEGPHVAVADVNADGLDDLFIGGAKGQGGQLMLQRRDGRFVSSQEQLFKRDRDAEDVGVLFFDADGNTSPDLYVVSGGSEYPATSPMLQDRLYLNDGRGHFAKSVGHVPHETLSGSRAIPVDFDGDGDLDLFVGGRVVPWGYGLEARSMLLRNHGLGRFVDATNELAPELGRAGMVTDAVWDDVDRDGRVDLVVVGEWMPITVFRNTETGFTRLDAKGLERSQGLWNRIVAGDFTGDGHTDFVVGNLGFNTPFGRDGAPATMYVSDFDRNGTVEQIIATRRGRNDHAIALRDDLIKALPHMQARFPTYGSYGGRSITDVLTSEERKGASMKQVQSFATSLVRSNADGSFTITPLPFDAQLAPVYGILPDDVDGDGHVDLLLAGNFEGVRPEIGILGASFGLLLRGDSVGGFAAMPAIESGFVVRGQARDIQRIRTARGKAYVVTRNNDRPLIFRFRQP